MNRKKRQVLQIILGILYVFLMSFFVYLSLENGNRSSETSGRVGNLIADILDFVFHTQIVRDESYFTLIRKLVGHYLYSLILGTVSFLFYSSFIRLRVWIRLSIHYVTGFLFALFTEFVLEAITQGRGPSFTDVLIDYSGFITLSLILSLIMILVLRNKAKKS